RPEPQAGGRAHFLGEREPGNQPGLHRLTSEQVGTIADEVEALVEQNPVVFAGAVEGEQHAFPRQPAGKGAVPGTGLDPEPHHVEGLYLAGAERVAVIEEQLEESAVAFVTQRYIAREVEISRGEPEPEEVGMP